MEKKWVNGCKQGAPVARGLVNFSGERADLQHPDSERGMF